MSRQDLAPADLGSSGGLDSVSKGGRKSSLHRFAIHCTRAIRRFSPLLSRADVLLLLAAIILYDVYWSQLSIARFQALHAGILDLGSFAQSGWEIVHGPYTWEHYWNALSTSGLAYLIAPLTSSGNYPAMLIFQTVALSAAAIPLYYVGARVTGNPTTGLLVSLAYLLSFAVGGVNWFDLHYEAFFVPLFVGGYASILAGRHKFGYVLLGASGFANFPLMIFPALFALQNLISPRWTAYTAVSKVWRPAPRSYDIILLLVAVAALISSYIELSTVGPNISGFLHASPSGTPAGASARLTTLLFLFAPCLFLPLFSPRWALYLLPFTYLVLTSPDNYYQYPYLFFTQYPAVILPFLFLGTVDAIAFIGHLHSRRSQIWTDDALATGRSTPPHVSSRLPVVFGTSVVVIGLAFGAYLLPYGPLNNQAEIPYQVSAYDPPNQTLYETLQELVNLVPTTDGNLLVQNSITVAYPRVPGNHNTILITGNTLAYNYTYLYDNRWWPAIIDYVIADTNSYTFYSQGAPPYNLSMETALTQLYESRQYGLMAEARGMFLLKRGYVGPLEYYVPQNEGFEASRLFVTSPTFRNGSLITAVNATGQGTVWFGPYAFVQPGVYSISYELETTNISASNFLHLDVLVNQSKTLLGTTLLNGTYFSRPNDWTNVTQTVYVPIGYFDLNLPANDVLWTGGISLAEINLNQIAPPSSRFQVQLGSYYTEAYSILNLVTLGSSLYLQPDLRGLAPSLPVDLEQSPLNFSSGPDFLFFSATSPAFQAGGPNGTESPRSLLDMALSRNVYGVAAEAGGFLLLENNYFGPPKYYIPQEETFFADTLFTTSPTFRNGSLITAVNATGQGTVWFGPYAFVQPGVYSISYELETTNISASNFLHLDVLVNQSKTLLGTTLLNGTYFSRPNDWTNVTQTVRVDNFYFDLNLPANDVRWYGALSVSSISISQITAW